MRNLIRFDSPGEFTRWEQQCLPIGNGYMGATFFGGIDAERIVLNEKTLWVGGPSATRPKYNNGIINGSYKYVKQVQEHLHDGYCKAAEELLPYLTGSTDGFGAYQLLCNMEINFGDIDKNKVTDYTRTLDIDNSLLTVQFTYDGAVFKREAFASYPSNVICIRLSADKPQRQSLRISLSGTQSGCKIHNNGDTIRYCGELEDNGLRYCMSAKVILNGGSAINSSKGIIAHECDEVCIYISAGTDYSDHYPSFRNGSDPRSAVEQRVQKACARGFDFLYKEHYDDYKALYDRVTLDIGGTDNDPPNADMLIRAYREGSDREKMDQLEMLYFQYGRYLLISSSRIGSLPANLQGVWNESNRPPWCCDYHINVNLQMNYWGAYTTNLHETAPPLIDYLESLRAPGRKCAAEYYNIVSDENHPENGWCAHTQSSPFGWTAPGWDFFWGWSTAAVAWLMQNIYEYYEFTGDREYFENHIYPIMRESVRFYTKWLIYDNNQQRLVSSPTYSPEHGPVTIGNTYEQSLIEQLYRDFVNASVELGTDIKLRNQVNDQLPLLKPYGISKTTGMLKEWFEEDDPSFDKSRIQPHHRHVSHLMGLYPGKAINSKTPELMEAAKKTLNDRGDESTGWARAYKLNLWARIKDGNRAYSILCGLLSGCTYDNLFDFHPPFQIDGNFGGSAGIAEMLLQSHEGCIELLPALPDAWKNGSFKGLCARHGFVLDVKWENGVITDTVIHSTIGGICTVKAADAAVTCDGKPIQAVKTLSGLIAFETEKGKSYTLKIS